MYKVIMAISFFVRLFYLPNPFEPLGNITIDYMGTAIPIPPIALKVLVEPLLYSFTYGIVGLYYRKGENSSATGSFLYLLFYIVHTFLLYVMSSFGFALWAVIGTIAIYLMAHYAINSIKNKIIYGGM